MKFLFLGTVLCGIMFCSTNASPNNVAMSESVAVVKIELSLPVVPVSAASPVPQQSVQSVQRSASRPDSFEPGSIKVYRLTKPGDRRDVRPFMWTHLGEKNINLEDIKNR